MSGFAATAFVPRGTTQNSEHLAEAYRSTNVLAPINRPRQFAQSNSLAVDRKEYDRQQTADSNRSWAVIFCVPLDEFNTTERDKEHQPLRQVERFH